MIFQESESVELKAIVVEDIKKEIIAFANCEGGKLYIGIQDDGTVLGLDNPDEAALQVSNMVRDAIKPDLTMFLHYETLTIAGKKIVAVDIQQGTERPYYIAKKGKETTAFIRINGTSRPADARKLKELELEGQNISYDSLQEIGREFDKEKALKLCETMKKIAVISCKTDEKNAAKDMTIEKLEDFGILCRVGRTLYPTHAFDLMTDNKSKASKIQCALFKGTIRDVFIDQKEFDGPIYEQVEKAYQFVLRHINMGAEIEGIYRNDSYELPVSAIREMIANAVVHRSYVDKSCIQVSIFDDRVEVLSPGMLYGGLDIETAKLGKSTCRNEAIAEAFHYMHIVEAWGTGIPRIINRCREYDLPEPTFEEFGNGFKVTMFRKVSNANEKVSNANEKVSNANEKVSNDNEKVSNTFEKYLPLFKEAEITEKFIENSGRVFLESGVDKPFGQANIMEWLGCSKSKATNVMNAMKAAKVIKKVTGLGAGKYKFIEL